MLKNEGIDMKQLAKDIEEAQSNPSINYDHIREQLAEQARIRNEIKSRRIASARAELDAMGFTEIKTRTLEREKQSRVAPDIKISPAAQGSGDVRAYKKG